MKENEMTLWTISEGETMRLATPVEVVLLKENAALKADAKRYRWLRDVADAADWESLGYQVDIDASIDAAMKA